MTPQQLMDLPGAGKAEAWLRKNGKWRLTPEEKSGKRMERLIDAIERAESAISDAEDEISRVSKFAIEIANMENHE